MHRSRKEISRRQKKKSKRLFFTLLGVIASILFIIIAILFFKITSHNSDTSNAETLIKQKYPTLTKTQLNNETTVYLPDNEILKNKTIDIINHQSNQNGIFYITSESTHNLNTNKIYYVSKDSQTINQTRLVDEFKTNQNNSKVITLADLIDSQQESVSKALKLAITKTAFESQKIDSSQFDTLKNQLQSLNLASLKFNLSQTDLNIELPENVANLATVQLKLGDVNHLLVSDFKQITTQNPVPTPGKKVIALTFDDGPRAGSTDQILNTLNQFNIKATFFMLGQSAKEFPEQVKKVKANGHLIGSHSYNHPVLTKLGSEDLAQQVNLTDRIIYETAQVFPTIFRPPYGARNKTVDDAIFKPLIEWNIDSEDWKKPAPDKLLQTIEQNIRSGSIVLMHDIHQTTADALPKILTYLKNSGYEFVTVDQLFNHNLLPMTNYYSQHDFR